MPETAHVSNSRNDINMVRTSEIEVTPFTLGMPARAGTPTTAMQASNITSSRFDANNRSDENESL